MSSGGESERKKNKSKHSAAISLILVAIAANFAGCPKNEPERKPVPPILIEEEPQVKEFKILRSDYEQVIKKGPQYVARWYFVVPYYERGRFIGYRVVDIYKESLKKGPIQIGDVIVAINDMPIERPEQAMAVWHGLWPRKTLKISLLRDGRKVEYIIPIVKDEQVKKRDTKRRK